MTRDRKYFNMILTQPITMGSTLMDRFHYGNEKVIDFAGIVRTEGDRLLFRPFGEEKDIVLKFSWHSHTVGNESRWRYTTKSEAISIPFTDKVFYLVADIEFTSDDVRWII